VAGARSLDSPVAVAEPVVEQCVVCVDAAIAR
jgi:hypothetical protein